MTDQTNHMTTAAALAQLSQSNDPEYAVLLEHGTLQVGYYKPDKIDEQEPHTRDEVYVIASGSGYFVNGDARHPFEIGEVLFVPAGVVHRFEDFSEDFAAWVFFYGPKGGEANNQ